MNFLPPSYYPLTQITCPSQYSPQKIVYTSPSPHYQNISISYQTEPDQSDFENNDLEQKYLDCISKTQDILAKSGVHFKNIEFTSSENLDKLYEKAIARSQISLNKYKGKLNENSNLKNVFERKDLKKSVPEANGHSQKASLLQTSITEKSKIEESKKKIDQQKFFFADPKTRFNPTSKAEPQIEISKKIDKSKAMEPQTILNNDCSLIDKTIGIIDDFKNFFYEGEVRNSKKNGFGMLRDLKSREVYRGEWKDGLFWGKGKLGNLDFESYEGRIDFNDFRNCSKKWVFYEGDFKNNNFEGQGSLVFMNGEKFSGYFKEGMVDGDGCFYRSDGELEPAVWEKGVMAKDL